MNPGIEPETLEFKKTMRPGRRKAISQDPFRVDIFERTIKSRSWRRSKMLNYKMVDLPRIAIIGKEGLCTKEKNVVQDLWQQANSNFGDIADLGMKNADGSFVGYWGAMSDETMSFMPWTDGFSRGLYLAGVEVYEDTAVPDGWVKWVMPARKYLVTEVQTENYGEIFGYVINSLLPELGMKLAGAVCDFTEPATRQNKLFFPVE